MIADVLIYTASVAMFICVVWGLVRAWKANVYDVTNFEGENDE